MYDYTQCSCYEPFLLDLGSATRPPNFLIKNQYCRFHEAKGVCCMRWAKAQPQLLNVVEKVRQSFRWCFFGVLSIRCNFLGELRGACWFLGQSAPQVSAPPA